MPEGPEVETIVRGLQQIVGAEIHSADTSLMKGLLKNRDEGFLQSSILGTTIVDITRHGKWIQFGLKDPGAPDKCFLLSHLGMFGSWVLGFDKLAPSLPHARVTLSLSVNRRPVRLTYSDMRSWGRLHIFTYPEVIQFMRGRIGVDATLVTPTQLEFLVRNDIRPICEMLLDQTKIAGIGNIYRSEILFQAKIAPDRPCTDLEPSEISLLWRAIRFVISKAIEARGSSIKDYRDASGQKGDFQNHLYAYGRQGQICKRCFLSGHVLSTIISTKRFDERSVFYCPTCQQ